MALRGVPPQGAAVAQRGESVRFVQKIHTRDGRSFSHRAHEMGARFYQGESAKSIGDDMGLSSTRVCQILHDFFGGQIAPEWSWEEGHLWAHRGKYPAQVGFRRLPLR